MSLNDIFNKKIFYIYFIEIDDDNYEEYWYIDEFYKWNSDIYCAEHFTYSEAIKIRNKLLNDNLCKNNKENLLICIDEEQMEFLDENK